VGSRGACRTLDVKSRDQLLTLIAIALTFGSGATDVSAFTRLGGVFTSVMTGNIVFFGLAAAEQSVSLATHTTVAIAGYIAGVAVASWVLHGAKVRGERSAAARAESDAKAESDARAESGERAAADVRAEADVRAAAEAAAARVLPGYVSWALFTELVLLAGAAAGWEITGARPLGWAQFVLLAVTAAAMGGQSAAVNEMGFSNFSTTFLTGTLTWLVSSVARPGGDPSGGLRRLSALIALAVGAGLSGLLVANAARLVPVLALIAMVTALVLSRVPVRGDD
jgi:uncharacterized membrane protein YoaK (UPF0700 family)